MKKLVAIVFLFVVLTSCKGEKPEFVRIDNVQIEGLRDSLLLVKMDYVIFNPNKVKTKLTASGMSLYYKETMVGKGYLDKQIALSSKDTINVPVRCEVSVDKISQFYPQLINSDSTAFQVKGSSDIQFLLKSFTIAANDIIYLNTKKIIRDEINKNIGNADNFKVKNVSVHELPSLNETTLKMEVVAKNNLPFDYKIKDMNLQFFLEEDESAVAGWKLNNGVDQKALSTASIPIDVTINNFGIFKQARLSWLTSGKATFRMVGEAAIVIEKYTFNVPINDKMSIDLKAFSGF